MPFCGLAVVETLSDRRANVVDPFLNFIENLPFQSLQPHQAAAVHATEESCKRHFWPKLKREPPTFSREAEAALAVWPNAQQRWSADKLAKAQASRAANRAQTLSLRSKL